MAGNPCVNDFVTDAQRAALFEPTASALGLPASVYAEPGFWQLEREKLFPSTWLACAFEADLPAEGSALPVSLAGWEIVLTRAADGEIRAFHNLCRHRGMRVVDDACENTQSLTCPFHAWSYDLHGRLNATPNIGGENVSDVEGFSRGELNLLSVRCETWMGFVFVNIDGEAAPLDEFLAPVSARLSQYDLSLLRSDGVSTSAPFEGNWKLVVEGGLENYHLPWVHPGSGGHKGITAPDVGEDGSYFGMTTRWRISSAASKRKRLPRFPCFSGDRPSDGYGWKDLFMFVFPGTAVIEVMPHCVVAVIILPIDATNSVMRRLVYFVGDEAMRAEFEENRHGTTAFWHEFALQDSAIVNTLQTQQRLRGELDVATRFSPYWETPVHEFQKVLVRRLS